LTPLTNVVNAAYCMSHIQHISPL